jgi:hypothetical protein
MRWPLAVVVAAWPGLLLAACSLLPGAVSSEYDVDVSNGTSLVIGIRVNGRPVTQVQANTGAQIPASGLGPLPWRVDAVTASGRVLVGMEVPAGSVGCTTAPDGGTPCFGRLAVVDLSCGRIVLFVGGPPSIPAPMPGAGEPGDCEP